MNMKEDNLGEAENNLARAIDANGYNRVAATLNIAKGNYALAEQQIGTTASNTAALAQLLNKNYEQAIKTLDAVSEPDALTSYLHAIVAARNGNKFATSSYLQEAIKKDPSLKSYSDDDLELSILK
jgi:tetratricopeptide (TPR) repeat protein